MAINLNDNLSLLAGKPLEKSYLNSSNVPYASVSEVNSTIPLAYRYTGLTTNILGLEYWYKEGVQDVDLILKTSAGGGGTISGSTNLSPVGVYKQTTAGILEFKGLSGGTGITLSGGSNSIVINNSLYTPFNTYTGTTAPATFANKSLVNTYTGITNTAITNLRNEILLNTVAVSGGVLNLHFQDTYQKRFSVSNAITGNTTITFSGTTNILLFTLDIKVTGTRTFTMPSSVVMQEDEPRWNNSTKVLTLAGGTASPFELSWSKSGSVYKLKATYRYYAS